ncbi:beta strand repeat-containing protein, partial [Planctomycetota bacterium]
TLGNIEVGTDVDWFKFTAIAGTEYEFKTQLDSLKDSQLRLYGTDGVTLLQFNNDGGDGLGSKIFWTAPSNGVYYLEVRPDSTGTGTYHLIASKAKILTLTIAPTSISENGGTAQVTVTRSPSNFGTLVVNLNSSDTSEATVPLHVLIHEGVYSTVFTLTAVDDALRDGTQTVKITASANGYYVLDMVTLLVLDDDSSSSDHGNNAASSTTISVPSSTPGNIGMITDVDWFNFTATAGTEYTFETLLDSLQDSELRLYATDGVTQLAFNDNSGAGLGSKIIWTAPSDGVYYLEVRPHGNRTGTYHLTTSRTNTLNTLSLSIDPASIDENGGTATGTVYRNGNTVGNLTVTLQSNDLTEATVPSTVTIPNGFTSAVFTLTAVDDTLLDGTQSVTITANADGYLSDADTIQVLDDDFIDHGDNAALSTAIQVPSSTPGNIRMATDVDWFNFAATAGTEYEFETVLDNLEDSELRLYDTDGVTELAFDDNNGDGLGSKIVWTAPSDGVYYLAVSPDSNGTGTYRLIASRTDTLNALSVTIDQASISENGGTATGTVYRNTGTLGHLSVNLQSNDTTEATVYLGVIIPDGSDSVVFTLTAVDDALIDGTQTVTITASAAGYVSGTDTIQVLDDEVDDHGNTPVSSTAIVVPSSTQGNIEVGTDVDWFKFAAVAGAEYTFETVLDSLQDSELRLYGTGGVTPLVFNDDGGAGLGSKIVWTAPSDGVYYLEVRPDGDVIGSYYLVTSRTDTQDTLSLIIDPASISENGGIATGTVYRNGSTIGNLTVTLQSNDTSEATVPSTVTIPNGFAFAVFTLTAVDDALMDGTQTVTITASAAGYVSDTDTIQVLDDDADDHGNDAASSTAIAVPSSTQGNIEVGTDVDWFKFAAAAGAEYTFETVLDSLQDSELRLYGTDGVTELAFDDNSGAGLGSKIVWTAPSDGVYYLEVRPDGDVTGTYRLITSRTDTLNALSVTIDQVSMSENGGTATGTIVRNGSTTGHLTVNLQSSDTTEATVFLGVIIPDGAASAVFTLNAVDDALVDGTQTVTITASAAGYLSGTDTIQVLDDDS